MTLRRRLNRATAPIEARWRAAWQAWAVEVVHRWLQADPEAASSYERGLALFEQEWASIASAAEEAAFTQRGAELLKRCGQEPHLWAWFWQEAYGPMLRGDLTCWPPPPDSVVWVFKLAGNLQSR